MYTGLLQAQMERLSAANLPVFSVKYLSKYFEHQLYHKRHECDSLGLSLFLGR